MARIAIIGGTGLARFDGLENIRTEFIATPYGEPSALLRHARVGDTEVVFLPRHGDPHRIPPHRVNYRANIWALHNAGVSGIIAVNAVGGITPQMEAGAICVPDQIVDYTWGRVHTYSDDADSPLQHVDFSYPYDEVLRQAIIDAAGELGTEIVDRGTYGATQGPRLESVGEINRMERDGCDLVGMTGMPEAALARELDLPYASICLVVNPAAGRTEGIITMEQIDAVMATGMETVKALLKASIIRLG